MTLRVCHRTGKVLKDRKQILEIGEPKQKLKEMREVIKEMAQGEDRSDLFPTVVKNVIAKSVEVCKFSSFSGRQCEDSQRTTH